MVASYALQKSSVKSKYPQTFVEEIPELHKTLIAIVPNKNLSRLYLLTFCFIITNLNPSQHPPVFTTPAAAAHVLNIIRETNLMTVTKCSILPVNIFNLFCHKICSCMSSWSSFNRQIPRIETHAGQKR